MKFVALVRTELKRLTGSPMQVLALVALMAVPLLYAGLYLWGNDDPYGNLDSVPAALVVDDEGAVQDGDDVNYGEQVRDDLIDDGTLDWHETSLADAQEGLTSGEFDFIVRFGPTFSESLTSIADDDPTKAVVELTTNDANSYLAGTIADTVTDTVRDSLTQEVGETAARTLLDSVATIRSGLGDAADGAATLADGTASAKEGADTLSSGAQEASSGASELASGLATLNSSVSEMPAKVAQLNDGAHQVADGNAQLNAQVAPAAQRVADAVARVPSEQDIRDRLTEIGLPAEQVDAVVGIVAPANDDLHQANDEVQAAAGAVAQLADGARQVADGTQQLNDSMPALTDGVSSAATGGQSLADGVAQLADGSAELASGLGELQDGSAELSSSLADAVTEIPDQSEDERETAAKMMSDPVSVTSDAETEASSYGAGMAPFFISLAAWIGIYALFLIVKPYSQRAVTALRKPLPITLGAWATPAVLGVIQMVAVFLIVAYGLGYSVAHPVGMLGIMAMTSVTFAAIILTLNVLLGSVGQFLGLVLMVLQLVSAGGTFPYQTLPAPLRALHEALPMSYSVDAIRQLMYGGDMSRVWHDAAFLGCWLVIAFGLAFIAITRMTRTRTIRDLRPSLLG